MKKRSKKYTIINALCTGFLWLLAIFFPFANLFGLWAIWHLVGFGMLFYYPLPLIAQISAIAVTANDPDKDGLIMNILSLVISIVLVISSLAIASTWGVFW